MVDLRIILNDVYVFRFSYKEAAFHRKSIPRSTLDWVHSLIPLLALLLSWNDHSCQTVNVDLVKLAVHI